MYRSRRGRFGPRPSGRAKAAATERHADKSRVKVTRPNVKKPQKNEERQVKDMQDERDRRADEEIDEFAEPSELPEGVSRAEMKRINGMSRLFDFVEILVLTVVAVLLITSFLIRHTLVQGPSMENTLINGQHLLISDVNYTPKNGDIVVFVPLNYGDRSTPFIKRVIAVEGQTVEIRSGVVLVDGLAQSEDYLSLSKGQSSYPETIVPEGYVFVLGDNRTRSRDSREDEVGMVDVRSILGKVVCRVWPLSGIGSVE